MSEIHFPSGLVLERLSRSHARAAFTCGQDKVDDWFRTKALQNQEKRLSVTKVLVDAAVVAGYYTIAIGQVDFSDLPAEETRKLPRRMLPVAILAWLGVGVDRQGAGLGKRLLSSALRDCHLAGQTFAFVAVILDALDEPTRGFYQRYDFQELPGHPFRLYLGVKNLDWMMAGSSSGNEP